ncbi:uncharacterized protein LOC144040151 isoform X3 [Vanacampus margaritifer]
MDPNARRVVSAAGRTRGPGPRWMMSRVCKNESWMRVEPPALQGEAVKSTLGSDECDQNLRKAPESLESNRSGNRKSCVLVFRVEEESEQLFRFDLKCAAAAPSYSATNAAYSISSCSAERRDQQTARSSR